MMVSYKKTSTQHPSETVRRSTLLPFHKPWIDESEIQGVAEVLGSGALGPGAKTIQFEDAFARYVGSKHAVAVNSCTAGLHLALDVIGLQPGDEVITSVYTFAATVAVALSLKAQPVLVDVKPDTLTIDPAHVEQKITDRTRVVMPVHLAGRPCDMDEISALAARHSLKVVEDAAHALPARYKGRLVGAIGDLTAFSFNPEKPITTAEGGIVTTDHDEHADRLRIRRLHGIDRDAWKHRAGKGSWYYEMVSHGYAHNMTDLNAALGIQQLGKSEMFHAIRSYHASLYTLGLSDLSELTLPEPGCADIQHAWQLYVVQLDLDQLMIDRDTFIQRLREENIEASVHFIPLHLHPYYSEVLGYRRDEFPNALRAYQRAVSLPLYPRMTEADVWDVIGAVRRIVESCRRRQPL